MTEIMVMVEIDHHHFLLSRFLFYLILFLMLVFGFSLNQGFSCMLLKVSLILLIIYRFIKERQEKDQAEVAVATKFAALPWRFGRGSVLSALKASLSRLGLSSVDLYQLHWLAC